MKYDAAIEQTVQQGAIRVFRLSDSTAYVYRFKDGRYEARVLSGDAESGEWETRDYWVTLGFRHDDEGWNAVVGLPWAAKPIEAEGAKDNPGYAEAAMRQCYTCKQVKPEAEFDRPSLGEHARRNWECNQCYQQRLGEIGRFKRNDDKRTGDSLEKDTIASPPPHKGEI